MEKEKWRVTGYKEQRVSVLQMKSLDRVGGDGCIAMLMDLMPLNCTIKNS